ncbi:MAG: polysaccharide pyruvyl transferase family protein [Ruminococcaceae bacterium]|nr:polysaccharide pyruvyl transferase family protein [Oscillospiraceae bacterium]
MMKRVGIITMYHNSENYGGILQAYALAKKLNLLGADAKQISFDACGSRVFAPKKSIVTSVKTTMAKILKMLSAGNARKSKIIQKFRDDIPHTSVVNPDNIKSIVNDFDVFITGSDQVWNPLAMCKEYLLSFVPPEKTKLSYAASISRDRLTGEEQAVFQNYLSTFTDISVRESHDVALLEECVNKKIEWVLDPVFLLDQAEWEDAACKRLIEKPYVFCYFLNDKNKDAALMKEFANQTNTVTVQIDGLTMSSKKMADQTIKNVGPRQFLSLIKHAEHVLTDSFHAMSFSFLFRKNFIVFPRNTERTMESRITSFLQLLGREDRFVDAKEVKVSELLALKPMDYNVSYQDFEERKAHSENFLKKYL